MLRCASVGASLFYMVSTTRKPLPQESPGYALLQSPMRPRSVEQVHFIWVPKSLLAHTLVCTVCIWFEHKVRNVSNASLGPHNGPMGEQKT